MTNNNRLQRILSKKGHIRAIGIDDAPFNKGVDQWVNIAGMICSATRLEGMLWGRVRYDGNDANSVITQMIRQSKFYDQVHVILLDGITIAGFNLINLHQLSQDLDRPCIAVMRKMPELATIKKVLQRFEDVQQRQYILEQAGPIHQSDPFFYQCHGCTPQQAQQVLLQATDTGHVPEALRLAHLIGSAVKTGQSSRRA